MPFVDAVTSGDPVAVVLSRLEGVKQLAPSQYQAHCPAHEDHRPSLSVGVGSDGRVLLYCHARCEFDAIVEAMGLKAGDLFADNGNISEGRPRIVATYDYQDTDGIPLFQTVRKHPKGFYQRRPDSNGSWINNLKGITPTLYHLPDLQRADPDHWVFVCEGEKSADAVASLGALTTTNPMGVGKWRASYSDSLQGRKVCILPDNDDQGQDHASRVASSLKNKAAEVRIVHLPVVTSRKSDPADWVAAGGTKEELLAMVEQAENVHDAPLYWDSETLPATADYIVALESLGYSFRMNQCNDAVEVNGEPMSDALRSKLRSQMRDLNYRQVNVMEDAWKSHAYDTSYHPVQEFLSRLQWDGQDHVSTLTGHFHDKHHYFHSFFRRWLIGTVARACEPHGCQNRVLVVDGDQGLGKSYFVRWLASPVDRPELFIEGPINPDDKDNHLRLITAWIWEVSELGSTTRRSDREALKYFLSMQQVTVRRPYGHYDLVKPALASFIGTVNDVGGFLDDPTGYRRFMSVHLQEIDWTYARRIDPKQLWAQAKTLYDRGEPWELTTTEVECARRANQEYEVDDPLQEIFLRHYTITGDPVHFVATVDIRDTLNGHGWRLNSPRAEAMAIAAMLKGLGVEKARSGGERGYFSIQRTTTQDY